MNRALSFSGSRVGVHPFIPKKEIDAAMRDETFYHGITSSVCIVVYDTEEAFSPGVEFVRTQISNSMTGEDIASCYKGVFMYDKKHDIFITYVEEAYRFGLVEVKPCGCDHMSGDELLDCARSAFMQDRFCVTKMWRGNKNGRGLKMNSNPRECAE